MIRVETEGYVSCQLTTYARRNGTDDPPIDDLDDDDDENEVDESSKNKERRQEGSEENEEICETIVSYDHILVTLSATLEPYGEGENVETRFEELRKIFATEFHACKIEQDSKEQNETELIGIAVAVGVTTVIICLLFTTLRVLWREIAVYGSPCPSESGEQESGESDKEPSCCSCFGCKIVCHKKSSDQNRVRKKAKSKVEVNF